METYRPQIAKKKKKNLTHRNMANDDIGLEDLLAIIAMF